MDNTSLVALKRAAKQAASAIHYAISLAVSEQRKIPIGQQKNVELLRPKGSKLNVVPLDFVIVLNTDGHLLERLAETYGLFVNGSRVLDFDRLVWLCDVAGLNMPTDVLEPFVRASAKSDLDLLIRLGLFLPVLFRRPGLHVRDFPPVEDRSSWEQFITRFAYPDGYIKRQRLLALLDLDREPDAFESVLGSLDKTERKKKRKGQSSSEDGDGDDDVADHKDRGEDADEDQKADAAAKSAGKGRGKRRPKPAEAVKVSAETIAAESKRRALEDIPPSVRTIIKRTLEQGVPKDKQVLRTRLRENCRSDASRKVVMTHAERYLQEHHSGGLVPAKLYADFGVSMGEMPVDDAATKAKVAAEAARAALRRFGHSLATKAEDKSLSKPPPIKKAVPKVVAAADDEDDRPVDLSRILRSSSAAMAAGAKVDVSRPVARVGADPRVRPSLSGQTGTSAPTTSGVRPRPDGRKVAEMRELSLHRDVDALTRQAIEDFPQSVRRAIEQMLKLGVPKDKDELRARVGERHHVPLIAGQIRNYLDRYLQVRHASGLSVPHLYADFGLEVPEIPTASVATEAPAPSVDAPERKVESAAVVTQVSELTVPPTAEASVTHVGATLVVARGEISEQPSSSVTSDPHALWSALQASLNALLPELKLRVAQAQRAVEEAEQRLQELKHVA